MDSIFIELLEASLIVGAIAALFLVLCGVAALISALTTLPGRNEH